MSHEFMFPHLQPALRFFTENKKAHWPRIIYPALVCAYVINTEQLYVKYTIHRPTEIAALSVISGGLFYYIYYFYVHKTIRVATDKLFGLPTFDVARLTLNECGLSNAAQSGYMVQAFLGEFFRRNPNIRNQETVMKSSVFHAGYMSCIITFGYCCFKYSANFEIWWSLLALGSFIIFLTCMWTDHKFGENEECIALQLNKKKFLEFVRRAQH